MEPMNDEAFDATVRGIVGDLLRQAISAEQACRQLIAVNEMAHCQGFEEGLAARTLLEKR